MLKSTPAARSAVHRLVAAGGEVNQAQGRLDLTSVSDRARPGQTIDFLLSSGGTRQRPSSFPQGTGPASTRDPRAITAGQTSGLPTRDDGDEANCGASHGWRCPIWASTIPPGRLSAVWESAAGHYGPGVGPVLAVVPPEPLLAFQLGWAPAGDEDLATFFNEPLHGCEPGPAAAARDDSDRSLTLAGNDR